MHPTSDELATNDTERSEERLDEGAGGLIWIVVAVAIALHLYLTVFS